MKSRKAGKGKMETRKSGKLESGSSNVVGIQIVYSLALNVTPLSAYAIANKIIVTTFA